MNWLTTEPVGVDSCTNCHNERELLAEDGDKDQSLCPECMYKQFGDEFLSEWVIGAGVVAEPEVHDEVVVFDYGYGIEVSFTLKESEMPASRRPSETDVIYYKTTASTNATVRYNGDTLGRVTAPKWAKYADKFLRPD
jgi:hypothetical protein